MVSSEAIEAALLALFTADGKMMSVEVGRDHLALSRPACNFAVIEGDYAAQGLRSSELKESLTIIAVVVTKNIRASAELERRKEAHPLVRYVVQKLWLNTLGLDIQPILPVRWRETTTASQLDAGLFTAEIQLKTSVSVARLSDDATAILLEGVLAGYDLHPEALGSPTIISDTILLTP